MPGGIPRLLARDKVRPAQPLLRCFHKRTRPARHKTPILGLLSCAGRTYSRILPPSEQAGRTFMRTGHSHVATMKPMTPLQPQMQASMKPPSPLRAPEQHPLKPPSPLRPKTAPKSPVSHPQRRQGFQLGLSRRPQRRRRCQTTGPAVPAGPSGDAHD